MSGELDDWVRTLTGGYVTEVKIVLTSIVASLAVYQVFLMAVGYGKLRLPFLNSRAASMAHRTVGDTIVPITLLVGLMCLAYFEIQDGIEHARPGEQGRVLLHVIVGFLLIAAITFKIIVVRWWHRLGRYLPIFGLTVFALFVLTWLTSSAAYL